MQGSDLEEDFERATSLRDRGEYAAAQAILERLADLHPNVFGVWLILGHVQRLQEDYEGAASSLGMATTLAPRSELASIGLFHTLLYVRPDDAFAEMRRFLALRPESYMYQLLLEELDEASA